MESRNAKLTENEVADLLKEQPQWALENGSLVRFWSFANFAEAMAFVIQVGRLAEAAGHHPDIDIRYNRIKLALTSHDAGGITARDASMVRQLGRLSL